MVEVLFHPDEAVASSHPHGLRAFRRALARRAGSGSGSFPNACPFPLQTNPAGMPGPIRWVAPTYHALTQGLTNPVYAGAYTYREDSLRTRYVDANGAVRKRMRGICPWNSGPFSSATIIPVSSIGPPLKPTRRGSIAIPNRCRTRREEQ